MAEYLLDVRPILDRIGASVHATDTFDLDVLTVGEETFVPLEPARFDVIISNAGEGLVPIGSVTAHVRAACVRCLVEFDLDISGDIEGFWLRPEDVAPEDQEITGQVDSEGRIDLAPALMATLVVEAPFAPLHDEECAGLCPSCGADLNEEPCGCAEEPSEDHPFAKLKDLVSDKTE